jgi:hypothetical protein
MHTPASVKARFPEWLNAPDTLVQACLTEAYARLPAGAWGARLDAGAGYLTCILLAESPQGRAMMKDADKGSTRYDRQYERLCRVVGVTPIVI